MIKYDVINTLYNLKYFNTLITLLYNVPKGMTVNMKILIYKNMYKLNGKGEE